jgi:miniconductance mechanosensitive channel
MYKFLEKIFSWCYPLFRKWGFEETIAAYSSLIINIFILSFLWYLIFIFFRFFLVKTMAVIARKTKTKFDDLLISNRTVVYISHLIPLLFIYESVPIILMP